MGVERSEGPECALEESSHKAGTSTKCKRETETDSDI